MCEFLSAIYTRTGAFYCIPEETNSHSDIIKKFQLREGANSENFVRLELTPQAWADVSTWRFKLDEKNAPSWWDEKKEDAESAIRAKAQSHIIDKPVDECANRFVILVEGGKIGSLKDGCVVVMIGGTIQYVCGGTIQYVRGGTIQHVYGGTIQYVRGGTIQCVDGGTIQCVDGGTIPAEISGWSTIIVYGGNLPETIKDTAVVIDRRGANSVCHTAGVTA